MISIQKIIAKYKFEIFAFIFITVIYFFLRLYNIMSLPMFTDEAIYVRWAQIARWDAAWRFISLTDGKQPMFVWIAMIFMRIIDDPLLASRLVSVMAGFLTMIGLFLLTAEIFKNRMIGIISSLLYVLYPFAVVYDRMAMYESLVGTFAVWCLYLGIVLIRRIRLDIALILSMALGAGILTKTSGFFSIYLLPFSLILFDVKRKAKLASLAKLILLMALSSSIAYAYYSILRLSPFFYIIGEKNAIFVYPFDEWIMHPLVYLLSNFSGLWNWFITYFTWPVLLLTLTSFFINYKFAREKILLGIWFILPFVALVLFGKTLYPRFIFFMTLPLLSLAAFSIYEIYTKARYKYVAILAIFAFLALFIRADYLIVNSFAKAPIADPDLGQYINDWPAGGGIDETISYLEKKAKNGKIYVISPGTFGSLPTYSVEIYLGENKNIEKRGIFPVPNEIPEDLLDKAEIMPVYVFVSSQKEFEDIIKLWPVKEIMRIKKGTKDAFTILYRVEAS